MVEEKILTFNLRRELLKVPRWERNKKAVRILKRRLKTDKIKIGSSLNQRIFRGHPSKIRVKITKLDADSIKVELVE